LNESLVWRHWMTLEFDLEHHPIRTDWIRVTWLPLNVGSLVLSEVGWPMCEFYEISRKCDRTRRGKSGHVTSRDRPVWLNKLRGLRHRITRLLLIELEHSKNPQQNFRKFFFYFHSSSLSKALLSLHYKSNFDSRKGWLPEISCYVKIHK